MQLAPLLALLALASADATVPDAPSAALITPVAASRVCLDAARTRLAIAENKLESPLAAQRVASEHAGGGEFLRSRLCRWNEEYIYEISLLSRDGKLMRVNVRADDGRVVGKNGE